LVFAANAVVAIYGYLVVVGKIQLTDLRQDEHSPSFSSSVSS